MNLKGFALFFVVFILVGTICFAGTMISEKTIIQNKERTYLVYLPTGFDAAKIYPLVFMFHGMGGSGEYAASDYYGIRDLADSKEFIAVFPDSLKDLPPKDFSFWWITIPEYDVAGFPGDQKYIRWDIGHVQSKNKCASQDIEFVIAMIDSISSKYKISPDHIFFMGHSYGALFSYYAAMCLPDKVTAFCGHSGGLVKFLNWFYFPIEAINAKKNPSLQVPGLLIHSTDDPIVPYAWDETLQKELTKKGHPNKLITLTGMGHEWDKSKNEAIWDWFKNHSPVLEQPIACYTDSDCGNNSESVNYCADNAIKKDIIVNTCVNPGTPSSYCKQEQVVKLVQQCSPTQECFNAECKDIACFTNTDCGLDSFVGEKYCIGKDVYRKKQIFSCNDPGKWTSSCSSTIEEVLVETCEYDCEAGACVVPECFSDSDCGTESWVSDNFCSGNKVLRTKEIPFCENPGTLQAKCNVKTEDVLQEECSYACHDGSCFVPVCTADSDCGAPTESEKYCKDGSVYKDVISFSCLNPGLFNSSCVSNKESVLVEACEFGCENAACIQKKKSDWDAKILAGLFNYNAIIWKNKKEQNWFIQFDYGNSEPLVEVLFSEYPGYDALAVDIEQKVPSQWWALWTHPDGSLGLYSQDSEGGNTLIKVLGTTEVRYPVDMGLIESNPYVLYQYYNGDAMIEKYNGKGYKLEKNLFKSLGEGWYVKKIATNHFDKLQILWTNNVDFKIWELNPDTLAKEKEYSFSIPTGYELKDLEIIGPNSAILFTGTDALIWVANQDVVENSNNIAIPNFEAIDLESQQNQKLALLIKNDYGKAKILKISNLVVESEKEYMAPN